MSPRDFVYWLQGHFELNPNAPPLNAAQMKMVREHLGYVFQHMQPEPAQQGAPTAGPTAEEAEAAKRVKESLEDLFRGRSWRTAPGGETVIC